MQHTLCCNYIESLLGIQYSCVFPTRTLTASGCNYIESLLGIETGIMATYGIRAHELLQLY